MYRILFIFNDSGAAGARPQHYPNQGMHGILHIFNDSGAAGGPPQNYQNKEMSRILYIFNDSGAAGAPPQLYPNQDMYGIPCIFNDSGAAGAPPQHYPNLMILEPPAPHHSTTQTRKCMDFFVHSSWQASESKKTHGFPYLLKHPPASPPFANCANPYTSIHFQRNSEGFQ